MPTKGDAPVLPGARAVARHVRISPMKARRVVNLVRGLPAKEALTVLQFAPQAASEPVYKVLASAIANATTTEGLERGTLVVTKALVDEGPTLKRFRPRAQGRAYRIRKRSCHITIVVESVPAAGTGRRGSAATGRGRAADITAAPSRRGAAKAAPEKATPAKASKKKADDDESTTVDAAPESSVSTEKKPAKKASKKAEPKAEKADEAETADGAEAEEGTE